MEATTKHTHWHLNKGDFFWELAAEKEEFVALSVKRNIRKNQSIFLEEDPGDSAFYLENGEVKIFRISSCGKESIVFIRHPGEMFGLAEAICNKNRACNAETMTHCTLYEIKRRELELLLSRHFSLAKRVMEIMGKRLRYLGEQVENLMVCDVTTRLLKLLIYLSYSSTLDSGLLNDPITVPTHLTQEKIAEMIGSCQQTVSETLKQLEQDGIINISRKKITLLKPAEIMARLYL